MTHKPPYEWTAQDAQAVGNFMGEVEMTLKIICAALIALAGTAVLALGYMVFQ